jgi:hypothetical protein
VLGQKEPRHGRWDAQQFRFHVVVVVGCCCRLMLAVAVVGSYLMNAPHNTNKVLRIQGHI